MRTPRAKYRVRNGATAGTNVAYETVVLCRQRLVNSVK